MHAPLPHTWTPWVRIIHTHTHNTGSESRLYIGSGCAVAGFSSVGPLSDLAPASWSPRDSKGKGPPSFLVSATKSDLHAKSGTSPCAWINGKSGLTKTEAMTAIFCRHSSVLPRCSQSLHGSGGKRRGYETQIWIRSEWWPCARSCWLRVVGVWSGYLQNWYDQTALERGWVWMGKGQEGGGGYSRRFSSSWSVCLTLTAPYSFFVSCLSTCILRLN